MALSDRLRVIRVAEPSDRTLAIEVMRATYKQEKNWSIEETRRRNSDYIVWLASELRG